MPNTQELISALKESVRIKNEAIIAAATTLECFMEPCNNKNCDISGSIPYHYRGCETKLKPIIKDLRKIAQS